MDEDGADTPRQLTPAERARAVADCLRCVKSAGAVLNLQGKHIGLLWPFPEIVTALGTASDSERLLLSYNHLGDEAAALLLQGARRPAEVSLAHNQVGEDGAAALTATLARLRGLTKLDLSANQIENEVIAGLLDALQAHPLLHLNLSSNTLGYEGASAFASHIKGNPHFPLATLDLSLNGIGDDGALIILEALQKQPYSCLTELDLSYNGITAEGVQRITETVKETLRITHLKVEDDGLDTDVTAALEQKVNAHKALQPRAIQVTGCSFDMAKVLLVVEPMVMKFLSIHLEYYADSAWHEVWEMTSHGGCMPGGRCEFHCQVNGLRPDTRYALRLRVRYINGSACSPVLLFSTLPQPLSPQRSSKSQ
eukprot:GGOE01061765.1.p1 GENE.GGOE01061765.1~~GGOE01061765.1.p1  ORF type:complete len:368 (+),score=105.81 GGOE01061765.1:141-1244(+)